MIAFCMCVCECVCICVDVDAESSPVAVARVKALIWMIIQDSKRVLTHPSNTQGVIGWEAGRRRCEMESKISLSLSQSIPVQCAAGPRCECRTVYNKWGLSKSAMTDEGDI